MNYREHLFEIWAPSAAPWSTWAKPVLFAHVPGQPGLESVAEALPLPNISPAEGRTAIVVDLPAGASIAAGMALARIGYRPVPLFNSVPGPRPLAELPLVAPPTVMVDVWPAVHGIVAFASELADLQLRVNAPPAFLLDEDRRTGRSLEPAPGVFDNRSISLPTDFPSSGFLIEHGIHQVVLIQATTAKPQADLSHTLLRWQDAGLPIQRYTLDPVGPQDGIIVQRPSNFRGLGQRLFAMIGLIRNPLGGLGGTLPMPSSG